MSCWYNVQVSVTNRMISYVEMSTVCQTFMIGVSCNRNMLWICDNEASKLAYYQKLVSIAQPSLMAGDGSWNRATSWLRLSLLCLCVCVWGFDNDTDSHKPWRQLEVYPTMLNEINCTFGVSFSRFYCCGRHGHGVWPTWFLAVMV